MPTRFDCEDRPNEFMEMPCSCDCGKWFDLDDGYSSEHSNKLMCRECYEVEQKEIEDQEAEDEAIEQLQNAKYELANCFDALNRKGQYSLDQSKIALLRQCEEIMLNFDNLIPKKESDPSGPYARGPGH
jgi:hypothetical protein